MGLDEICRHTEILEKQQGFRKNRSTFGAIFIIKEIAETSLEYNKPNYMRFVNMSLNGHRQNNANKKLNHRLIKLLTAKQT